MKKIGIGLLILGIIGAAFFGQKKGEKRVVGVIVPMEHAALSEIVGGLKEVLRGEQVEVRVMNAQGDPNIQKAMIEKLMQDRCDLLIPIGTSASQMTLNLAKDRKVVCLAADRALITEKQKERATALDDELSAKDSVALLHEIFPRLKKITLLYSASEKVANEIAIAIEAATDLGIGVQKLMVQNMGELYTACGAIASDSEAIFVLKDHLIVSGIQTVAKAAETRGIPLMTSDEGSVASGAAFAIGVKEASIGKQGAEMVKTILGGASVETVSPQTVKGPYPLFINRSACGRQGIDAEDLMQKVHAFGIPTEVVGRN